MSTELFSSTGFKPLLTKYPPFKTTLALTPKLPCQWKSVHKAFNKITLMKNRTIITADIVADVWNAAGSADSSQYWQLRFVKIGSSSTERSDIAASSEVHWRTHGVRCKCSTKFSYLQAIYLYHELSFSN